MSIVATLILLCAACGQVPESTASALKVDALPKGVSWLNLPSEQEREYTGDRVVVFAREPTGQGEWDFLSSVWEIRPGEKEPVKARVKFGKSDWSPSTLSRDPEFPFRDLVRAQFGRTVRLFQVNFRTWETRMLCDEWGVGELFWHKDNVWLDVRDVRLVWGQAEPPADVRVLRHVSGTLEKPKVDFEYVRPLRPSDTRHLVHVKSAKEGEYAVFDATTEAVVATCVLPKEAASHYSEVAINDELTMCAVHLHTSVSPGVDFSQIGAWQFAPSTITFVPVHKVGDGAGGLEKMPEAVPVGVYAAPGSGLMFSLTGPRMAFGKSGRLVFASAPKPEDGKAPELSKMRMYTFDPKTGATTEAKADEGGAALRGRRRELAAPEYLGDLVKRPCFDEHDLAFAFLKWKGVKFEPPRAWNMAAAAFSEDGKRFALKMFGGGREDVFFVGDLEAKTLREVPSPEVLRRANDMSMMWVMGK